MVGDRKKGKEREGQTETCFLPLVHGAEREPRAPQVVHDQVLGGGDDVRARAAPEAGVDAQVVVRELADEGRSVRREERGVRGVVEQLRTEGWGRGGKGIE